MSIHGNAERLEDQAAALESSGNYRVLRRLGARERFHADDGTAKRLGVVLDVETTGLNPANCEIIELGMVKFEFAADGRIFRVVEVFEGLRQPSHPIPAEITDITGITDDMVAGQTIDPAEVGRIIDDVAVIIAHNAGFDRNFCERFAPCFASRAWACSVTEIGWRQEGFEGSRLGYLLMGAGLFHDGHRATEDCRALLEILARPLPKSGEPALKRLLDTARRATVRLWAQNSPFDMKDVLKARGYKWSSGDDGRPKCWWRDVAEDQTEAELTFLRQEIYGRDADIPIARLTAFDRFSGRI